MIGRNWSAEQRARAEALSCEMFQGIRRTAEAPLAGVRAALQQAERTAAAVRAELAALPAKEDRDSAFPAEVELEPEHTAPTANRSRGPPPRKENPARRAAAGLSQEMSFDGDPSSLAQNAPQNQAPSSAADRARLQFLARRLHQLGEKPLFHFLDELQHGANLRASLEEYANLPTELIKAYHGDRFASPFAIEGGRL